MLARSPHVTPATAELHVGRSVACVFLVLLACSGVKLETTCAWRRKKDGEGGWKAGRQLTGPFRIY